MTLREAREMLLKQHGHIRQLMDGIDLALNKESVDTADLSRRVVELRVAVSTHNDAEEAVLKPVLEHADAWGPQRVAQLLAEHQVEHHGILARLDTPQQCEPDVLRGLLAELGEHIASEEKSLLTEKLLRDDIIQLDAGD